MSTKEKAGRNRTVTVKNEEIPLLQQRILKLEDINSSTDLVNKTINADLFEAINKIPDGFADLIIIDPPYNLTKNFNGMKFWMD